MKFVMEFQNLLSRRQHVEANGNECRRAGFLSRDSSFTEKDEMLQLCMQSIRGGFPKARKRRQDEQNQVVRQKSPKNCRVRVHGATRMS